jgi:ankyrin repeat protein
MESGGTDIESVPGKSVPADQHTGATIPLMVDCARSNNHEAAEELGKNNGDGAGCTLDRNSKEVVPVPKVNMEMVKLGRNTLHKVDAQDVFGNTALHRATYQANPDKVIINLLINHGADIGAKNKLGDTPLHLATEQANPDKEVIRLLITHGADIGVRNKSGEIPRLSATDYQELFDGAISIVTAGNNILVRSICWENG